MNPREDHTTLHFHSTQHQRLVGLAASADIVVSWEGVANLSGAARARRPYPTRVSHSDRASAGSGRSTRWIPPAGGG